MQKKKKKNMYILDRNIENLDWDMGDLIGVGFDVKIDSSSFAHDTASHIFALTSQWICLNS